MERGNNLKKKITLVLILTLLIATTILPVSGIKNIDKVELKKQGFGGEKETNPTTCDDVDSWPMFQHDAENTGFSPSSFPDSLNLSYNLTYSKIINSTFWSFDPSPIVANGKIFIAGIGTEIDIISLNENNGSLIWKKGLLNGSSGISDVNSPVVSNGKVFVCYASQFSFPPQSKIFALDENTGDLIWDSHIYVNSAHPSLTISDDKIIVGGHFSNILPISLLYAFDANSGDLIWRKIILGYYESTATVSNNTVFAITSCKSAMTIGLNAPLFSGRARVYAFDLNNGNKIWNTRVRGHVILASPSVSNGKLLVPSTIITGLFSWNRRITALDIKTGEEIWYYHIKQNALNSCWPASISTPSIAYGKIFVNDASGIIFALDEETGEMLWNSEIIDEIEGASQCSCVPPVIAGHKVITTSAEITNMTDEINIICMFNVSNGEKIWSIEFDSFAIWTPFAIANGKLFVNTNQSIYVYS